MPNSSFREAKRLAELYPAAIAPPGSKEPRRPLMIGALEAILARAPTTAEGSPFSKTRLRDALADYCHGPRYLLGILDAEARVDLEGNPAGEVTEHHREVARRDLARLERRRAAVRLGKRPIAWRVTRPSRPSLAPVPPRNPEPAVASRGLARPAPRPAGPGRGRGCACADVPPGAPACPRDGRGRRPAPRRVSLG